MSDQTTVVSRDGLSPQMGIDRNFWCLPAAYRRTVMVRDLSPNYLKSLVGVEGLEPSTR